MEVSIDIADALQSALNAAGRAASAVPLPDDFEESLPFTRVEPLGGRRRDLVIDTFNVHFDTWAERPSEAIGEANLVVATLLDMQGGMLGGVQCYSVALGSLPYEAVDADRPGLPMASFMAQVTVRTRHVGA